MNESIWRTFSREKLIASSKCVNKLFYVTRFRVFYLLSFYRAIGTEFNVFDFLVASEQSVKLESVVQVILGSKATYHKNA